MLELRTILHPTDFSERSAPAFDLACSLARDHGARLIVLHVVSRPVAQGDVMRAHSDQHHDEMWNALQGLQAPDKRVVIEHRLADGEPHAEILRVALESDCDLIIMGTHGRTGLGRLLVGSVAEQVLRQAPCPVLTVKTPFPNSRIQTTQTAEP